MSRCGFRVWVMGWLLGMFLLAGVSGAFAQGMLTLSLPATVTEGDGLLPGAGIVAIEESAVTDVLIGLSWNSANYAFDVILPESVTILSGQTFATFDVFVQDDPALDGVQTVSVIATATGYGPAMATIQVLDNETATLTMEAPASVPEGYGLISGGARVRVSASVHTDVSVSLRSSDPAKITVPETVTVSAGMDRAGFDLIIPDDLRVDGSPLVTISAAVPGWTSGTAVVRVIDNDNALTTPSVSAGGYHTLARHGSGTVWAWGDNYSGQLGDGTTTERRTPVQVSGLIDVIAIAGGASSALP